MKPLSPILGVGDCFEYHRSFGLSVLKKGDLSWFTLEAQDNIFLKSNNLWDICIFVRPKLWDCCRIASRYRKLTIF